MAKVLDNPQGRRMIRLSPEDIVHVVRYYQQSTRQAATHTYNAQFNQLEAQTEQFPLYLPEEV